MTDRKLHERTVFGRGPDCDVVVDDVYVAPQHVAIRIEEDGRALVEDLGSVNGTWIRRTGDPVPQLGTFGMIRVHNLAHIEPEKYTIRIGRTDISFMELQSGAKAWRVGR